VSNVVATFLRLWIEANGMPPATEHRLRAAPVLPMPYVVTDTPDFSRWNPFHTNPAGISLNIPVNALPAEQPAQHFRVLPQP
jgi:hypothetical protein